MRTSLQSKAMGRGHPHTTFIALYYSLHVLILINPQVPPSLSQAMDLAILFLLNDQFKEEMMYFL